MRDEVACFRYGKGHDLSGYEDGTENPTEDAAVRAAILAGAGAGLDGSSFVAAQRWVHGLDALERLDAAARDALVGRRLSDNEELPDAPLSAHVKRAAQESFDPPAFMVRRSMPWGGVNEHGLYFVRTASRSTDSSASFVAWQGSTMGSSTGCSPSRERSAAATTGAPRSTPGELSTSPRSPASERACAASAPEPGREPLHNMA